MRFARLGEPGQERDAVLTDDEHALLLDEPGASTFDVDDLRRRAEVVLGAGRPATELATVRVGAPVRPGKVVCVGANYADHVRESGVEMPTEPVVFLKNADTVVGPRDDVLIPRSSTKTDWEVELGVVVGATASYCADEATAMERVAGYVLADDVSERAFQLERGGTWDKGKNCPTFCPMGPWFVTADEVADPQSVRLGLDVSGRCYQDSTTAEMIFGVPHLVWYLSQFMTLNPGDVLLTGTPVGVGMGQSPPRYLRAGDTLRVWAEGLGEQRNTVRQG